MKILQRFKRFITSKKSKKNLKNVLTSLLIMAVLTEPAYAGTSIPTVDAILSWIVDVLTGTLARFVAIITVCNIGYKCKQREITVKEAAIEIGGIGIVMGAATIVDVWGIF